MHRKVAHLVAAMAVAYILSVDRVAGQCTMKHSHNEINDYENLMTLVYRLQDAMEQQQNQLTKLEETVLSLKEDL
ncbi:hypothetical protein LSAT2_028457, partial [Lamellibrachia satsuma]